MTKLTYPMVYITRKEKGDTQKKVASKLGISPQRYQLKESGKAIFNLNECQILSEMYDMPIDELFSSKIKVEGSRQ
ncbi:TPA: helix-turn-helix transcriptional regulator [Staphylococcus aureus]|nr:helix-turn-helix transcriptional regulator [Staphylococcus aureus]